MVRERGRELESLPWFRASELVQRGRDVEREELMSRCRRRRVVWGKGRENDCGGGRNDDEEMESAG